MKSSCQAARQPSCLLTRLDPLVYNDDCAKQTYWWLLSAIRGGEVPRAARQRMREEAPWRRPRQFGATLRGESRQTR